MKLTVALAQIPVTRSIADNLAAVRRSIDFAASHGADILLTPEGSLSGYTHDFNAGELDAALRVAEADAAGRRVGLALDTCKYESDGLCYNELRFYSRDGEFLGAHTKTLLCGSMDEEPHGEIRHYATKPLRVFQFEGICIGGLICNDMWGNPYCTPMPDPHLSHCLAAMGAKVIFHAVNGGRDASELSQVTVKRFHEVHVLLQAGADRLHIATVDNSSPENLPVSSVGGIAGPDARWAYRLNEAGSQWGVYTLEVDQQSVS